MSDVQFTPEDPVALLAAVLQGQKKISKRDKNRYVRAIKQRLTLAALTTGEWKGIPDNIDSRFIEQTLFNYGLGIFFFENTGEKADSNGDGILLEPRFTFNQASAGGGINDQWASTEFIAISPGVSRKIETKGPLENWEGVPIFDNVGYYMGMGKYIKETISFYANRIAEAMLTVDVNLENTRTQKVAAVNKKEAKGASQIFDMIESGNGIALFDGANGRSIDEVVSVLDFGVDARTVEAVHGIQVKLMGEAYNAIGVQAEQNEKSAQQNVAEITSDDAMVASIRLGRSDARKRAAEQINKRFGLQVEWVDSGTGKSSDSDKEDPVAEEPKKKFWSR